MENIDKLKILVVDDSATARHGLVSMLTKLGAARPAEAGSVEEAFNVLKREHEKTAFHLILCDHIMHEKTGLDLLKSVRSEVTMKNVLFVVITAQADSEIILDYVQAGSVGYINKPVQLKDLQDKLSVALAQLGA